VPLDIAREHRGQRVSHGVARAKDLTHAALTDGCGDFVDAEAGTGLSAKSMDYTVEARHLFINAPADLIPTADSVRT
jgi:hypothetical protein